MLSLISTAFSQQSSLPIPETQAHKPVSAPPHADPRPNDPEQAQAQRSAYYQKLLADWLRQHSYLSETWREFRSFPILDLAYRYLNAGQSDKAIEELNRLLAVDPENLFALWQKALVLISEGRGTVAEESLDDLLSYYLEFSPAYLIKGNLASSRGDWALALRHYNSALLYGNLTEADKAAALASGAQAALQIDDKEEALNALNQLRELGVATPEERLIRADLLANFNRTQAAISEWNSLSSLIEAPDKKRALVINRAIAQIESNNNDEAYENLFSAWKAQLFAGHAVDAVQRRTFTRLLVGSATAAGQSRQLIEALQRAPLARMSLDERVQLAYALRNAEQEQAAQTALLSEEGTLLDFEGAPTQQVTNYLTAVVDLLWNTPREALAAQAGRALTKRGDSPQSVLLLANVAAERNFEVLASQLLVEYRARATPEQLKKDPQIWADFLYRLGKISRSTGDLSNALVSFRQSDLLVRKWQTLKELAEIYRIDSRPTDALKYYQNALDIAPSQTLNADEKRALSQLYFGFGTLLIQMGDLNRGFAMYLYDWNLSQDPAAITPAYLTLLKANRAHQEGREWLQLVSRKGKNAEARAESLLFLARSLKGQNHEQEALSVYKASLRLEQRPEARLEAAAMLLVMDRSGEAMQLLLAPFPEEFKPLAGVYRCAALDELGGQIDAIKQFECPTQPATIPKEDPINILRATVDAHIKVGNFLAAAKQLEDLYKTAPSGEAALQTAYTYAKAAHPVAVKRWLALAFYAHKVPAAGLELASREMQGGNKAAALKLLKRLNPNTLSLNQQVVHYSLRAQILGDQAETLAKQGAAEPALNRKITKLREEALSNLQQALSILNGLPASGDFPASTGLNLRYSQIYITMSLGELDKAEQLFQSLPTRDLHDANLLSLGGYLAIAREDAHAAIERFDESLALRPNQPAVHEDLAYQLLKTYQNKRASQQFKIVVQGLNKRHLDLVEEDKKRRIQRQLKIIDYPFWVLASNSVSPVSDETQNVGSVLGIASSSPFGSIEAGWRPPIIGYRNGQVFEFITRFQWNNEAASLTPDDDSTQAILGVRFKPFERHNLKLGLERFFGVGDNTQDNWLGRIMWSYTKGNDFLPLYTKTAKGIQSTTGQPYYSLYVEVAQFLENEANTLAYGDGRIGYTFNIGDKTILSPYVYSIGSSNWADGTPQYAVEVGAGASFKWQGWSTEYYGDHVQVELYGRAGHEVTSSDGSTEERILFGLQASF